MCVTPVPENMANFEVDLLLRELGVGEEVTLQVLYNPIGKWSWTL
jgi:hypothetical protein